MKILVIGQGGREHALIKALDDSATETTLYSYPGSGAISELAELVEAEDLPQLVKTMQSLDIELCIAGEESCLVRGEGINALCQEAGIACWGPPKESGMLEASKVFAKQFMQKHQIPTGSYDTASSLEEAQEKMPNLPVVLKFDGLAAGKGVAVCTEQSQVDEFLAEVFADQRFGSGDLLIEECLEGPEISVFCSVVDDKYQILTPARDYKRIGEGDKGLNTGGMGAVASPQIVSQEILGEIETSIIKPTVEGLQKDGLPYRGFLYFGIMLTPDGPKILEYNCRFGDPECQAVMPLLEGDFAAYVAAAARGDLQPELFQSSDAWSVCVVLASAGYPTSSSSGDQITGLENVLEAIVYHAGTKKSEAGYVTAGGRVLAVVAQGQSREEAVEKAHQQAALVDFDGFQRRSDIGRLHFDKPTLEFT